MRKFIATIIVLIAGATTAHTAGAQPLVESDWLKANLDRAEVAVLDIRNRIDGGSPEAFAEGHIPGAVYSNYLTAGWRTTMDDTPGMLPPTAGLERLIGGLGIGGGDHVVVVHGGVSSSDFGSAARVYWTFKVLGHENVSILDGGWAGWKADPTNPVETGASAPAAKTFTANFQPQYLATTEDVQLALANGGVDLVDARPEVQFIGKEKSGAVRAPGTIPGAINLQQSTLVAENGGFQSKGTIATLMEKVGLRIEGDKIAFCNTGHWASIAWFAMSEVAGNKQTKMYDGSMAKWAADPARPLEARVAAN